MGTKTNRYIRSIAAQLGMFQLKTDMGHISFGKIQKTLMKPKDMSNCEFWGCYSRTFYQHAKGMPIKKKVVIEKINEYSPSAKMIITHPVWEVLENKSMDLETVHNFLLYRLPRYHKYFFKYNNKTGVCERKVWLNQKPLRQISKQNNIDALAVLLLVCREYELLGKWHSFIFTQWEIYELVLRLSFVFPYNIIPDKFYWAISKLFLQSKDPDSMELPEWISETLVRKHFIGPKQLPTVLGAEDLHFELISKASHEKILLKSSDEYILEFLFWVDNSGKRQIYEALFSDDRTKEQAYLLKNLQRALNGTAKDKFLHYPSTFFANL